MIVQDMQEYLNKNKHLSSRLSSLKPINLFDRRLKRDISRYGIGFGIFQYSKENRDHARQQLLTKFGCNNEELEISKSKIYKFASFYEILSYDNKLLYQSDFLLLLLILSKF